MKAETRQRLKRLFHIWKVISIWLVLAILLVTAYITYVWRDVELMPHSLTPLKPLDRSSPRALLISYLDGAEKLAEAYNKYRLHPSATTQSNVTYANERIMRSLDTSQIPPAQRSNRAPELSVMLWDVLCRIDLPPFEEIPGTPAPEVASEAQDPEQQKLNEQERAEAEKLKTWTIPNTEITMAKQTEGPRAGQWVFSANTVALIPEFFQLTRHIGYQRPMDLGLDPRNIQSLVGGWLIPPMVVESMPGWLKFDVLGQAMWKWLATFFMFAAATLITVGVFGWAWLPTRKHRLWSYFRRLATPLTILALLPGFYYIERYQIITRGDLGAALGYMLPFMAFYLALAWASWLIVNFLAELIITSPRIGPQSTDAHLIRLAFRVTGIVIVVVLLFNMGTALGIPLYGLIAGAGVGTLAIALAAQSTLENFIGSLNLFADRPLSTGDFCVYGTERGTVEEIGLRSTRIRGTDRTIHTIPNAELSKMTIINYNKRDRMLLRHNLSLRLETSPDQLRHVILSLREMLIAHPRVLEKPCRVRLRNIAEYSLELEIFAFANTNDWNEFLGIQEDVLLRVLEIVRKSGTGFAVPARTNYVTRDRGLNPDASRDAEAAVAKWREENRLHFPDHDDAALDELKSTLSYPPEGSVHHQRKHDPEID